MRTSGEANSLLASPVYRGQAQGEEEKKKNLWKEETKLSLWLSSLHVFWVDLPSRLEDVFSFACQIKLSCNTGSIYRFRFLLQWDRTEEIAHSPDKCYIDSEKQNDWWVWMVVSILVVYTLVPDWELPSIARVYVLPITITGQDKNSEFHVPFLLNACIAFAPS